MCLGIPGRIEEVFQAHGIRMGRCAFGGIFKEVCLEYVPELQVGDYAIVHAGFAISRLDEQAAQETLRLLEALGDLQEELPT
jgi:hydrogenase expression/formation protein HypC